MVADCILTSFSADPRSASEPIGYVKTKLSIDKTGFSSTTEDNPRLNTILINRFKFMDFFQRGGGLIPLHKLSAAGAINQ